MDWKTILHKLQKGEMRSAYRNKVGDWEVNITAKKAILKAFSESENIELDGNFSGFVEKENLKTRKFSLADKVRMAPGGSSVRIGSYVAESVIIMPPSYINVGAFIDTGTMIDSHVLVGSCAQVGRNVHLSAGVQIGGVLEPIGMSPVIVEDNCFIGAGAVIVEGIIVGKGAVVAPGVVLSKSINIYDCVNHVVLNKGANIPEGAVIVPGTRPIKESWAHSKELNAYCPIIIKYRDDKSNKSLTLEEALR